MFKKINKEAQCIRKVGNFSKQEKNHKIDKDNFDLKDFSKNLENISPKAIALINNIKELDNADMINYKKTFKHVIYTDLKESSAGSKMIAASLMTKGYTNIYDKNLKIDENKISNNYNNNFALLCSVQIYNKPFPVKLKNNIISKFNERPDNINGKNIRFIIIDSGYKEGIDLFDVKYIHIFEPLITNSDEKQVIGRGTRFCGQKGLVFEPNLGWPLHVYKYNSNIQSEDTNVHDMFMFHSGIDISKLLFSPELENISKYGAIDYELNINIHELGDKSLSDGNIYTKYKKKLLNTFTLANKVKDPLLIKKKSNGGGIKGKKKKGINLNLEKSPNKILKFLEMRKYISDRFSKYKWETIIFKNNCVNDNNKNLSFKKFKSHGGKSLPLPAKNAPPSIEPKDERLITLTPTQEFVSKFFNNSSVYKGLLLWHSVGTGKTCSAIATATKGFEEHDYTILWVTKHTLKADIWKNMFKQVCSSVIRRKIINGEDVPRDIKKNYLKYLSKKWIMPISYKQFSNMLSEKNKIYKLMTKINGKTDPLRKTLVIIDEAHKLYSPDTIAAERPNVEIMNDKIKSSYKLSGKDSVKLLLMTATPYTSDPMHLIKLINLMKETDLIPEDYDEFTSKYLNKEDTTFTEKGAEKYLNSISGYISYLNREKDARNFAYPVFHNINVDISENNNIDELKKDIDNETDKLNKNTEELETIDSADKEGKKLLKNNIKENKLKIKNYKIEFKKIMEKDNSQATLINRCVLKKK
jgi:superfamily II DNA or RNA helicase